MSEIGLNINVNSYNNEGIKTIKGNNNAEIYKLYILKNKRRLSLVGKTVKLGYVMAGTTKGDIIENLNITNAEQGEITFPITNRISKKDGVYSCQLAIYGEDEFLEYTATFGLTVEANIFTKIAGEIENSKDLTYIERILEEATNISEELKSNIPVARQLNIDLENQNRILNENMDRSNGVNNTLITTTEQSKVAATDAIEKKSQLEKSITKAKEFIDGLDGSQNIPGIRMELTELQNGLKSNQALAYMGSSINAENTLEGRTEGMRIDGMTLLNCILTPIINRTYTGNSSQQMQNYKVLRKANTLYTIIAFISKNTLNNSFSLISWGRTSNGNPISITSGEKGLIKKTFTTNDNTEDFFLEVWKESSTGEIKIDYMMVLEGDWTNKEVPSYFEGMKSFGEAEKVEDKYKISILSRNKNLFVIEQAEKGKYINYVNGDIIENDKLFLSDYIYIGDLNNIIFNDITQCAFYDINKKFIKGLSGIQVIDLSDKNYKYIRFWNDLNKINKFQLEVGKVNTNYLTGQVNKKDILIKEPLHEDNFLYEYNGQVKIDKFKGQYIFTGNENIERRIMANEIKTIGFGIRVSSLENCKMGGECLSNNFIYSESNHCWNVDKECVSIADFLHFRIDKSKLTTPDVEGFKAWLKANPTTVVYQLATPTVEVVDGVIDIDLDTFGEKTYFNILNSLPGSLDFKVPSNIGSVVQNMAKEVNNIWDVINNLLVPGILDVNKKVALATIKNNLK